MTPLMGTLGAASTRMYGQGIGPDRNILIGQTFVSASQATGFVPTMSFNVPVATGFNRMLVVTYAVEAVTDEITSVGHRITYAGNELTRAVGVTGKNLGGGQWQRAEIWYLSAPPTGTGSLVTMISGSGTRNGLNVGATILYNVSQWPPYTSSFSVAQTDTAALLTSSIASLYTNTLLIDMVTHASSTAVLTPRNGQTELYDTGSNAGMRSAAATKLITGSAVMLEGWDISPALSTTQASCHAVIAIANAGA